MLQACLLWVAAEMTMSGDKNFDRETLEYALAELGRRAFAAGVACKLEDGVDALSEFSIGQADDDTGAHVRMRHHRGLDLGRVDIGAAAQDDVGEPIAKIEIAVGVEPADVAKRFPAVGTAFWLGAEIVIGATGAVVGEEIDFAGLAGRDVIAVLADNPQAGRFADPA